MESTPPAPPASVPPRAANRPKPPLPSADQVACYTSKIILSYYTVSQENDTDVAHYNFNVH